MHRIKTAMVSLNFVSTVIEDVTLLMPPTASAKLYFQHPTFLAFCGITYFRAV